MNLEDLHEMGKRVEQWLRMRVHPIAVKLLEDGQNLPEGTVIPSRDMGKRLNLCQAFSMAQRNGLCIAMFKRDCNLAVPCRGDRQVAMAQDDEIFFSLVPEMLPDFIAGIAWLEQNQWGIPMKHFLKEEVEMRPKYQEIGKLLG